jgi:hypothetical protein
MKPHQEEFLRKAREYAASQEGGECLATEYKTAKTKTLWDCKKGHPIFEADFQIVSRGSWCVLCARERNAKKATLSDGLERAHAHAAKEGGYCLSTEYKTAKTKLKWKCKRNHEWESNFDHAVTRDRWCQQCFYEDSYEQGFAEKAKEYAKSKEHNGSVILPEDKKVNTATKLTWQCFNPKHPNHTSWQATYRNVVEKGGWCPYCAGKFTQEEYLQMAKDYAISKKWRCISKEYIDQRSQLMWKCEEHGEWLESYNSLIDKNGGCRKCRNKLNPEEYLEKAKEYAISKGGKCLSTEYITQNKKLTWKCNNHGSWESDYGNVVSNKRWCPTCFREEQQKICLERANKYASDREGKCLTSIFNNIEDIFEWQCRDDSHPTWKSKYRIILGNKTWCPVCGIYYQKENQTRKLLEYLLGFSLDKAKPEWNINPETGNLLEFDGYSESKNLAFEYQGRHHYQDNVFKNANQSLATIQFKDKVKAKHCFDRGITLLIIDGRKKRDTSKRMVKFLQEILDSHNLTYREDVDLEEVEKIFNSARLDKCDNSKK